MKIHLHKNIASAKQEKYDVEKINISDIDGIKVSGDGEVLSFRLLNGKYRYLSLSGLKEMLLNLSGNTHGEYDNLALTTLNKIALLSNEVVDKLKNTGVKTPNQIAIDESVKKVDWASPLYGEKIKFDVYHDGEIIGERLPQSRIAWCIANHLAIRQFSFEQIRSTFYDPNVSIRSAKYIIGKDEYSRLKHGDAWRYSACIEETVDGESLWAFNNFSLWVTSSSGKKIPGNTIRLIDAMRLRDYEVRPSN